MDAISPELLLRQRRAAKFFKASLKNSTSNVFFTAVTSTGVLACGTPIHASWLPRFFPWLAGSISVQRNLTLNSAERTSNRKLRQFLDLRFGYSR